MIKKFLLFLSASMTTQFVEAQSDQNVKLLPHDFNYPQDVTDANQRAANIRNSPEWRSTTSFGSGYFKGLDLTLPNSQSYNGDPLTLSLEKWEKIYSRIFNQKTGEADLDNYNKIYNFISSEFEERINYLIGSNSTSKNKGDFDKCIKELSLMLLEYKSNRANRKSVEDKMNELNSLLFP